MKTYKPSYTYKPTGEKRYTSNFWITLVHNKKRIRIPAFRDEYKSKELALKLEHLLFVGWDNLTIPDISYWATLDVDIKKDLVLKGFINTSDVVLYLEGLREVSISLVNEAHIYFLIKDNEVVYIGQSLHVGKRITAHFVEGIKKFDRIFIKTLTDISSIELNKLERYYIEKYKPKYNVNLKRKAIA